MTFAECEVDAIFVDPRGIISDHSLVICRLPVVLSTSLAAERLVRGWHRVDRGELRRELENLCRHSSADTSADELFATYEAVPRDIADRLAKPRTVRCRPGGLAPWFDADCRATRCDCRRLERIY